MQKKPQFRVSPLHSNKIPYDALVDRHLEYYFSSKKNRNILVKTKVVNRKNEIIDRDLKKMIDHGELSISNKFRLKKSKVKTDHCKRYGSVDPHIPVVNLTLGK